MTSVWEDLDDAVYDDPNMGADAVLTPKDGTALTIRVLDRREGVSLDVGDAEFHSLSPAADVRRSELEANDIDVSTLIGGTLALAGTIWRISSWMPVPGASGTRGEVRLILQGRQT